MFSRRFSSHLGVPPPNLCIIRPFPLLAVHPPIKSITIESLKYNNPLGIINALIHHHRRGSNESLPTRNCGGRLQTRLCEDFLNLCPSSCTLPCTRPAVLFDEPCTAICEVYG
ncbi:hypothetical protein H4Q26_011892 [Puccinia striiformis f. sp. tritici PST-130]|nr:hypothetical protein H4Q26_011892 [Puccinia striiformis f. sp. tritici PST-130]